MICTEVPASTLPEVNSEAFMRKMVAIVNQGALAFMISLGHRTGIFDRMATLPASTSAEIAAATNLNERYVREWLGAMATGGIVEHRPREGTYRLPQEHAAWLTRAASPNNLASGTQWFAVLGAVEDKVLEAFRHGRGVPYSAYNRFHEVMAEESGQTVVAALFNHILPIVPALPERLAGGIRVLDVACGSGRAIVEMAAHYPRSKFVGIDASPEGIAAANAEAGRRGVKNAQFVVGDCASLDMRGAFDLITAFDAIHDQAKPADVLKNVARALHPDGVFLMQDISGHGHVHADMNHAFGPLLYTISCMHCMSVSLANGGPGLGAMWGKELALTMLADAGFNDVRVEALPHDPLNFYYIARAV